jgi:hypothetical protein
LSAAAPRAFGNAKDGRAGSTHQLPYDDQEMRVIRSEPEQKAGRGRGGANQAPRYWRIRLRPSAAIFRSVLIPPLIFLQCGTPAQELVNLIQASGNIHRARRAKFGVKFLPGQPASAPVRNAALSRATGETAQEKNAPHNPSSGPESRSPILTLAKRTRRTRQRRDEKRHGMACPTHPTFDPPTPMRSPKSVLRAALQGLQAGSRRGRRNGLGHCGTAGAASGGVETRAVEGATGDATHLPGVMSNAFACRSGPGPSCRWPVFIPEMQRWEHFAAEFTEVYIGEPLWPKAGLPGKTDAKVIRAEKWLSDRITMVVCDAEAEAPTLDWLLERVEAAVLRDGVTDLRDGVTDLLIDPWNEITQQRGETSETDYIGRALQRLKAFAQRHGCNVWIIAHPAKPAPVKGNEKRAARGLYDISGSSHWATRLTWASPSIQQIQAARRFTS